MKFWNGRSMLATAVTLAVVGLSVTGLWSAEVGFGGDTGLPTDVLTSGKITVSAGNAAPTAGDDVTISVALADENGQPLAGVDCTFTIASQPGNDASVDPATATTDANGQASTTLHVGSAAGQIVVQVDCGGLTGTVSVVAGAAQAPAPPPASAPSPAAPPASLPDAGTGAYLATDGSAGIALAMTLGVVGIALLTAGLATARYGWHRRGG